MWRGEEEALGEEEKGMEEVLGVQGQEEVHGVEVAKRAYCAAMC